MARSTRQQLDEAQEHIAEALKEQPDKYIECRGMLHAWRTLNDFHLLPNHSKRGPQFLRRDLECMRGCGVVRHDTYLLRFVGSQPFIQDKVGAHYSYPDDYQIPGIPRGVKRSIIVQQEAFRRTQERLGRVLRAVE